LRATSRYGALLGLQTEQSGRNRCALSKRISSGKRASNGSAAGSSNGRNASRPKSRRATTRAAKRQKRQPPS